jgi:hypothetical protein
MLGKVTLGLGAALFAVLGASAVQPPAATSAPTAFLCGGLNSSAGLTVDVGQHASCVISTQDDVTFLVISNDSGNPMFAGSPGVKDTDPDPGDLVLDLFALDDNQTPGPVTVTFHYHCMSEFTDVLHAAEEGSAGLDFPITCVNTALKVTILAEPITLECGGVSAISGTVQDSDDQNVPDGTQVHLSSPFGVVSPSLEATVPVVGQIAIVETVGGRYTGLLRTSTSRTSYEVVAVVNSPNRKDSDLVTVVCTPPEATANLDILITPPSTGDAGLAGPSAKDNTSLLSVAAAVVLAGLASLRLAGAKL